MASFVSWMFYGSLCFQICTFLVPLPAAIHANSCPPYKISTLSPSEATRGSMLQPVRLLSLVIPYQTDQARTVGPYLFPRRSGIASPPIISLRRPPPYDRLHSNCHVTSLERSLPGMGKAGNSTFCGMGSRGFEDTWGYRYVHSIVFLVVYHVSEICIARY